MTDRWSHDETLHGQLKKVGRTILKLRARGFAESTIELLLGKDREVQEQVLDQCEELGIDLGIDREAS